MSDKEQPALTTMLEAIREAVGTEERSEFTRKNIVTLLEVIAGHLAPQLEEPLGHDDTLEVVMEHAGIALLQGLISALRDLDTGLTDTIFEPYQHGANATLPWNVRALDDALIEVLKVYRKKYRLNQIMAATTLANDLNAKGILRRGKALTGRSLQRLKYGPTKRKG